MCHICIMLDQSFPSPKELSNAVHEEALTRDHLDVVYHKAQAKAIELEIDWGTYRKQLVKDALERLGL